MSGERENTTEIDEFSYHLMNTTPIVETILKYLNAIQLNRCATVCQFWGRIVKRLKRKRCTRSWTCLKQPEGNEDITSIQEGTKQFLQNQYTEPDVVFMMCESDLLSTELTTSTQSRKGRKCQRNLENYQKYVRSLLPKSCRLVGVGAGGIVGTSVDCKESYEVENGSMGVSFLCLPKYEGVNISLCEDMDETDNEEEIQQFYESLAQPAMSACKVVLMLISDFHTPRSFGTKMMKVLADSLVAGAYVDEITPLNQDEYSFVRLAAVSGDSVQVASVIIDEKIDDAQGAEECVKKLKAHKLPEEKSFAFMFACLGRGAGLYNEPNIESSLFRKYFPNTPLIGLFGNGEIGFEKFPQPDFKTEPDFKKKKSPVNLYHSYTTVLVLVSIT